MSETRVKIIPTKVGTVWEAARKYKLLDYLVIDGATMYLSKKVDDSGVNLGHSLTNTDWWEKCIDLADVVEKAKKAVDDCEQAGVGANDAATQANAAAQNAQTQATKAAATADAAMKATKLANDAAQAANTATEGANTVNAKLGKDNVLMVTDREGNSAQVPLGDAADVARMKQSLGPYSDRPDIVLAASQTGYVVSKDGVKTAKAGWAMAEFTAELGNEYLFKPGATDGSVCVFAEYIDKVERRAIEYAYTYDEKGRVATAKATYDGKTHSYTYAYTTQESTAAAGTEAQGEVCVITDDQTGQTVDYLPATYQTKVGSYQPLTLLNDDAELPVDGYCRFVSNFQARAAIKVVVSYKVDVADLNMKIVRDGMTASMCTQLSKINQKVDEAKATTETLQKRLNMFGDAFVGFARISGDNDPKPSPDYVYGTRKQIREIGKHMKLGTVKRVGNEAVLQHECAPGRITLAANGEAMKVNGTEGDLLIYTDIPLHVIRANGMLEGFEMSCMGVGMVPCYWQGYASKEFEPFAFSPFYTVNTKLEGDERTCAHCVISDEIAGSGSAAAGTVKNPLNVDGKGYPTWAVSGLNSIHMAQNKNADANTNYPYMGCYYEFYELWIMMMFIELGTLDTADLYHFGVGCTHSSIANEATWADDRMAAVSGVKTFKADGSVVKYSGIMDQTWKKGASGAKSYNLRGMFGGSFYVITKCGEIQMLLDGITKAGLQEKVGQPQNIFYFNTDGNVVCSEDGSINVSTGTGMEVNKRYYVVRDVPNCQGISEGVMTAVANCYIKMEFADGTYCDDTDLTGGYVIGKFSHSCYRGMSLPFDGMFRQLCGAHYTSSKIGGNYVDYFYYANKWQDIVPLTSDVVYSDVGTDFNILHGLTNKISTSGASGFIKKIDYTRNLFCIDEFGRNLYTCECCYIWNSHYIWGACKDGLPEEGKEGVKALAVGCSAGRGYAASRTAHCYAAVSHSDGAYAGAVAVPQLKLKQ